MIARLPLKKIILKSLNVTLENVISVN